MLATPLQTCRKYASSVLVAIKTNDLDVVEKSVLDCKEVADKTENEENFIFTKQFFKLCLWLYRKPNLYQQLSSCGTGFNHAFVWPVIQFAMKNIKQYNLKFMPAGYCLKASKELYQEEGQRVGFGQRHLQSSMHM
ncbi:uncharacterized protein BX663DRAFT_504517 [Cokeromyces recurvatus]|uniref:uncharacterized protein n=1 Tax=Cokeromyces recurvatus TaxID=90255 RepID=UPI00221EAC89|nr:uncharacterized protein BX663DRAFT_504517 [Cokeromyces recurvatus]KAI7904270.1 hypothetical protein BX663DRAFT_504517 [Cokeromyces recurvatus]